MLLSLPWPRRAGAAREALPDCSADQVRALYEQTSVALASNAVVLALIAAMFWGLADAATLGAWTVAMLLQLACRVWLFLRFPGADAPLPRLLAWRRGWNAVALASAAGWGAAVWLFYGLGSTFHFIALVLVVYSYLLGGVQFLVTQPLVYLGFISLGMLPTIARVAIDDSDRYHLPLAGIMTLLFALTLGLSVVYRRAFESTLRLKARTEQLADQLRREKADAEAARRAAEVASRAKTQFFAAASHDLRQPLHALGLFAEALRSRTPDEQAAQLVNSINESVDALEGLFNALLDITRIDSGGIEARPEHFRVGELFTRLELHFAPTAFEKGLRLAFRGGAQHAFADPLLVDRILRNLVSNAIRYTEDGSVLVCCRRRGERLALQVWDTGVGIGAREQERVFEEFYRVADDAALRPNERKGLGLGLAIVRRLAALLDAPLTLRSTPGRGSVFTLELPAGRPARAEPPALSDKGGLGLDLTGRRLVVVEDEP
ncbi:MAG: sensor histidine kinase, partial [Betaproteobacteria bacterium]